MKTVSKITVLLLSILFVISLVGCGGEEDPTAEPATATAAPDPFSLTPIFATAIPTATQEGMDTAPTSIPAPTEIAAPTESSEVSGPSIDVESAPGIVLSETLGLPGETVTVSGSGFEPDEPISLHWSDPNGGLGPVATNTVADETGEMVDVTLEVPPSDQWPGGSAEEEEFIQLRAKSETWADTQYYWANFRYIVRFNPGAAVLPYLNETFGNGLTLPNGWAWDYEDDEQTRVNFTGPSGGGGFVYIVSGSTMTETIAAIMGEVAAGQSYSITPGTIGGYTGTEAVTTGGFKVIFVERGGNIYAIRIADASGAFNDSIANTVTLP